MRRTRPASVSLIHGVPSPRASQQSRPSLAVGGLPCCSHRSFFAIAWSEHIREPCRKWSVTALFFHLSKRRNNASMAGGMLASASQAHYPSVHHQPQLQTRHPAAHSFHQRATCQGSLAALLATKPPELPRAIHSPEARDCSSRRVGFPTHFSVATRDQCSSCSAS